MFLLKDKQKDISLLASIIVVCIFLLIVGLVLLINKNVNDDKKKPIIIPTSVEDIVWLTYESKKFGFRVDYPEHWDVFVQEKKAPLVISFYKKDVKVKPPFTPDDNVTNVSIYPQGINSRTPVGDKRESSFDTQAEEIIRDDIILTNGQPWATYINFLEYPSFWRPWGFIWSSLYISDLDYKCSRSGSTVDINDCNVTDGDIILRSGFVDEEDRDIESKIVSSFEFIE